MTGISWTDETWNPVRGCSRVSEGCRHCYAEQQAARIVRMGRGKPTTYDGLVRVVGGEARWTGRVVFDPAKLADPLRWRTPRRVFVNSMSDLFHDELTNEQIAAVFGVMAATQHITYQVLTKRARRMREWFEWAAHADNGDRMTSGDLAVYLDDTACDAIAGHFNRCHLGLTSPGAFSWPLPNCWIGVSVENRDALHRLDDLRAIPAAVRMVSAEPLLEDLGPVDLREIGWLISGCESGLLARPIGSEAFRSLRDQCSAAGVPFFLKQAVESSARTPTSRSASWPNTSLHGNLIEFGPGSRRKPGGVIELPYLDGVQWAQFPEVRA